MKFSFILQWKPEITQNTSPDGTTVGLMTRIQDGCPRNRDLFPVGTRDFSHI
jgi:hypothetical protein